MKPAAEEICTHLISVVSTMTEDWGFDDLEIDTGTRISEDLCFSSIDLLNLLATVDVHYQRKLPYDELIMDGDRYRTDITLMQLATFVHDKFDTAAPAVRAM